MKCRSSQFNRVLQCSSTRSGDILKALGLKFQQPLAPRWAVVTLLLLACVAMLTGAPANAAGRNSSNTNAVGLSAPVTGLVINPGAAAFGDVKTGTTSPTLSFTATNHTTSTVGYISLSGSSRFNLQPGTCHLVSGEVMLAVGASCTFTASFSPTTLGSASATINISTASGPYTFQLTGYGVPAIAVLVTPASAVFGNVAVGSVSPTLSFTAVNDTDSTIGYISTAGSPEFRLSPGTCHLANNQVMLAEDSSCVFYAAFAPTTPGAATASLNISTSSGPFTFQLTGTGVSALPVSKSGGPYTGLTSQAITFSGSASTAPSGQTVTGYTWNFGDGTSGTGATPAHVYSAPGTYNVTLTVKDTNGQTAAATTTAKVTAGANPLTVTAHVSPAANSAGWNNTLVTVSFTCSSTGSPVVQCPTPQTVSTDVAGQIISGTVTDAAGDTKTASVTVNLEATPPVLTVTSPSANSNVTLSTSSIGISGNVSSTAATIVSVTCNGAAATVSGTAFSCTTGLTAGANPLPIVATDIAGNRTTIPLNITYVAAPALHILSPANLSVTNLTPITVNGTVSDTHSTVTLDGVTVAQSGGAFSTPVPLVEGLNLLTAVATNAAGVSTTATIEITLDTTPPHVQINSPANGSVLTASSVSVTGLANDVVVGTVNLQDLGVTVNGVAAQVANRSFSALNVPLALGPNTIQATGTDRAGNSATTSVTVTRVLASQPPAPAVGAAVLTQWVNIVSGNNQTAGVGKVLANPVVVSLTDSASHPLPNKTVVFQIAANNGLVAAAGHAPSSAVAVTTDANGQAQVSWTLGQRAGAGNNVLQVSSALAVSPVTFTATGTTGAAAMVVVDSGNNQTGVLGQTLPFPFVVDVVDPGHNRVPGVPIVFTVKKGGGNFAGASTSSVTTDSNGRAIAVLTAGLTEGIDNNLVEASFAGNTFMPAAFVATAKAPGNASATTISGVVLDNSNRPIPGVTIRLYKTNQGSGNNLPVQVGNSLLTDALGSFVISPAPIGSFKLMADGSTATTASSYPTIEYDIVTVSGNNNTVGMPIYLPALDTVNKICVDETHGGILTLPQYPGFALNIPAGSATFPGGSRTGCVSATPVNGDKVPMAPGFGQQPRFIVTIQPVGTVFSPPAAMSLPNVDGLPAKSVTEMYSYDHDLSMFVAIGTGTVSSDGSIIKSDPGVGVVKAGWHCGGNPNSTGSAGTCPTCQKCTGASCVADDSAVPPGDKCAKCENGKVKDFEPDPPVVDQSLKGEVKLPDNLKNLANSLLSKIGIPLEFEEADVNFQGTEKDCCDPASGVVTHNGEKTATVGVTLMAGLKNIQLWPPPPAGVIDHTWSVTDPFGNIYELRVVFLAGVFFTSDITLGGNAGLRRSACDSAQNCAFGGFTGDFSNAFKVQVSAQACAETSLSTTQLCTPTLDITPAAIAFNITGQAGYNQSKCGAGLSGSLKVGAVKFSADFKVPLLPKVTYEATIFDGFCLLGC